jgi:hypothetical protein
MRSEGRRTEKAGHVVYWLGAYIIEDGVRKDVFGVRVHYSVGVWICLQDRRVDIALGVAAYGAIDW